MNVDDGEKTTAGVRGSPSGSSVPTEGYITTKKQLRHVIESLEVGSEVSFHKANFWCKDLGFHYHLFILRLSGTEYMMTFTDYHAMYSNHPVKHLDSAVDTAWRWIKFHNTRKYLSIPSYGITRW